MTVSMTPATPRGERTRQRLLEAAEHAFGEDGYHRTSVSTITGRAGVAQGTFYIYFPSKEHIFRALMEHMFQRMRRLLAEAAENANDRIDAERRGLEAFLAFILDNQNLYRIVLQSQFVDEDIHRDYFEALLDAYTQHIASAQEQGEVRAGDPSTLAWLLIGVAYFMGMRYPNWQHRLPDEAVMQTVHSFIRDGLRPER